MSFGLMTEPAAGIRITGKIVSSIMPGWWIVEDDQGRRYRAASDKLYRRGDLVAMVGGQIVGRAGSPRKPMTYRI